MHGQNSIDSIAVTVCFLEQNPISVEYLTGLLRGHNFRVVDEQQICNGQLSLDRWPFIVVVDERSVAPERRLVMRSFRIRFPKVKFLVLGRETPSGEGCCPLLGVEGFILYSRLKKDFVEALRALSEGRLWLPPSILEYMARVTLERNGMGMPFTSRESDVIRLIGEGLSNKEIGSRLGVAERTVKFHAANVFAKLGVHDRASATEIAHSLLSKTRTYKPPELPLPPRR